MAKRVFMVVGLGRFGASVATTLYESGFEVMAIDVDADRVDAMQDHATHAVQADATDSEALVTLGVRNFDVAIITISTDIKASSIATMLMKECGVPMVIAKAHDEMHGRLLKKLGANRVIFPERDTGRRLAHNLASGNILDYIEVSPDVSLMEIEPPPAWVNRSLADLDLRHKGINVIAIRSGDSVNVSVHGETVIKGGDILLVVGTKEALRRFERAI